MKDVCAINQSITDKFKYLDDEQYQSEYEEHCRKMSIIDSYEEEIKEVLFLSSGCVDKTTYSFKKYGLGLSPDYIGLATLVNSLQSLRAKRLNLDYTDGFDVFYSHFINEEDSSRHSLNFVRHNENKEYIEYFISIVNKYSKEFYSKEYFLRCEGSFVNSYYVLVTKDETWKMEYLRNVDTLHSWKGFTFAVLVPIFGWLFVLYSICEAVKLYLKYKVK